MNFLLRKFFDAKCLIKKHFLTEKNELLKLETDVSKELKKEFRDNFFCEILKKGIINQPIIDSVGQENPWSIDFPSWFGSFDEKKGKPVFIIGSEPHIQNEYLQTVYGLSSKTDVSALPDMLFFLSELLKKYFKAETKESVLEGCYITDLVPFSPYRNRENKIPVGTPESIQTVLGDNGNWTELRYNFAKESLLLEIEAVSPKIIIAQGEDVFKVVLSIIGITESKIEYGFVELGAKKKKYKLRKIKCKEFTIISVPHIGSNNTKWIWKNESNRNKLIAGFYEILDKS